MGEVIAMPAGQEGPEAAARARRERMGRAIRIARGGLTQAQFAARLDLRQPAISAWEAGKVCLTAELLWSIESAFDLQHGWLGVAGGMVDPSLNPLAVLLEASVADLRHQGL